MTDQQIDRVLSLFTVLALSAFLIQLTRTRSIQRFKLLFAYLLVFLAEHVTLLLIPIHTVLYANVYYAFRALNLIVACGAVREIYRLALAAHPALASFGDSVIVWAVTVALGVAILGLALDREMQPGQYRRLHIFFSFERSGDSVLLLLLLMISSYLAWFPVKLSRNIVFYASGFTVFFAVRAFALLAVNLLPQAALRSLSNGVMSVELLCVLFLFWGFHGPGAEQEEVVGHRWNPLEMDRLTRQLDSINSALERFRRS